ncbi:ammonium transporter [Salinispira pacifica]|uniref:Ammonium transporter n=1 Tax=Salinispira pacifica TaxID=1307761 RepID=V5WGG2_9SPIO|nr:ammonium transporter [Salinispira pacifica]AHC14710.1 Ammonium transporter [Salinispira pacifica]
MKGKFRISAILVVIALLLSTGVLSAQDLTAETVAAAVDMIWLTLAAALVFFMQAGFAMVEIGLTQAKNSGNIIMKNLMDFSVGAIAYWAIGWAFMYGNSIGGWIGGAGGEAFFLNYSPAGLEAYGVSAMTDIYRDWIFQVVFAATAATIVSGAMAERTKFTAYLVYSVFISALIYPIAGHWHWGGGWLAQLGFHDFAGSTLVHSLGGWAALAGAVVLGPRSGKYTKVGNKVVTKAIPGHSLPLAALGVFILWFGWFGFNAGSTLSGNDATIGHVAVTTTLAASAGAIAAMITSWVWFGKPDPSMSLNGALAGLVGITAGTWVVGPGASIIIGLVAGILVVLSVEFFDKVLHIDDPVGAISVHGINGAWGTLAIGLFANGVNDPGVVGIFFDFSAGLQQLGVQALGVLAYLIWTLVTGFILFFTVKKTMGLRVDEKDERTGLDITEHATDSYAGFQIFSNL